MRRQEEEEIFTFIQEGQDVDLSKDVLEQEESILSHPSKSPC